MPNPFARAVTTQPNAYNPGPQGPGSYTGLGTQARPAGGIPVMPNGVPSAAPVSAAPPSASGGDFFSRLFGGGAPSGTGQQILQKLAQEEAMNPKQNRVLTLANILIANPNLAHGITSDQFDNLFKLASSGQPVNQFFQAGNQVVGVDQATGDVMANVTIPQSVVTSVTSDRVTIVDPSKPDVNGNPTITSFPIGPQQELKFESGRVILVDKSDPSKFSIVGTLPPMPSAPTETKASESTLLYARSLGQTTGVAAIDGLSPTQAGQRYQDSLRTTQNLLATLLGGGGGGGEVIPGDTGGVPALEGAPAPAPAEEPAPAGAPAASAAPAKPEDVPTKPDGSVDASKLKSGTVYNWSSQDYTGPVQWDGKNMNPVEWDARTRSYVPVK